MKIFLTLLVVTSFAGAQAHGPSHQEQVNRRGALVMGFDQLKTKHSFTPTRQGGVIEVNALSATDSESIEQIRKHLSELPAKFSAGDFGPSEQTHGRVPPGAPVMKQLREEIGYKYEQLPLGGKIVITTKNAKARSAIHAYLRFQIADHRTGDSPHVH